MLIDGISKVTFVNGIMRVQCLVIDPNGKEVESGTLEIPGGNIINIINGLANSAKSLEEKLKEMESINKKDSSAKKDTKKTKK
jgi:hypothetical protein